MVNVGRIRLNTLGFFFVGVGLFLLLRSIGGWLFGGITQLRPREAPKTVVAPRLHQENLLIVKTEPGYDKFAIGVRTTSKVFDVNLQRVTTQSVTFLQWVKQVVVMGEMSMHLGAFPVTRIKSIKDKHLSGLAFIRHKFPDADWYLLIDDTTYVFLPNLLHHIQKFNLDPKKPHYVGYGMHFRGCAGVADYGDGPMFALGNGGILVSKAAMDLILDTQNGCIPSVIKKFADCDVSDVRLALCLHSVGVSIGDAAQRFGFHPAPPTSMNFPWPNPCEVPVTMANARDVGLMHALYETERLVREETYDEIRMGRLEVARKQYELETMPEPRKNQRQRQKENSQRWDEHNFMPKQEPILKISSPVPYGDVYELLYTRLRNQDSYMPGTTRIGSSLVNTTTVDWESCQEECNKMAECFSWTFDPRSEDCSLKSSIPMAKKFKETISGVVSDHYKCNELPRELDFERTLDLEDPTDVQ